MTSTMYAVSDSAICNYSLQGIIEEYYFIRNEEPGILRGDGTPNNQAHLLGTRNSKIAELEK